MQETQIPSQVQEDPTCRWATKLVRHNSWAHTQSLRAPTTKPMSLNYWACVPQLRKPVHRAGALQQEKPLQWEARASQQKVAPSRPSRESMHATQTQCSQK